MTEYIINKKTYQLNLFDKLDYNSSYLIGYLAGDGGFNDRTHKRNSRLAVSSINEDFIQWVVTNYCPTTPYRSIIPINNKRNIITKNKSHILILSSKFSPIFNKYGILSLKANRKYVNISKKLFKEYLKGLIDADGYFSGGLRKDRNRLWLKFNITHQSIDLLRSVQTLLNEILNISSYIYTRNNENCIDLTISRIDDVKKLINWLLLDDNCPFYKKKQIDYLLNVMGSDAS